MVGRTYGERTKHLLVLNQRKADAPGLAGGVANALRGLLIIPGLSQKDIWNELLRVSIVEREPGGLDLDHLAVTAVYAGRSSIPGVNSSTSLHGSGFR